MTSYRVESDSMGDVKVPTDALYSAQTQRACNNFTVSPYVLPEAFIKAVLHIKQAAAQANFQAGILDTSAYRAITHSTQVLLANFDPSHFPVDVFQTGSGTSTNMNVNEVIATHASKESNEAILPNDHVNMSQSSNDVIPTAIQISCAKGLTGELLPALEHAMTVISTKAETLKTTVKTGRTHLMDAMPVTFAQVLMAWHSQLAHCHQLLSQHLNQLVQLPLGGTAVGTGVNTPQHFATDACDALSKALGLTFSPSDNPFFGIGSQDVSVALAGSLNTLACAHMKLANDLRWMNSGPLAGLGDIELEALQPGSSIMPGKVNPVIPEAAAMVSAKVMGNHTSVSVAGQSGNFELNVMLPVVAFCQLESIHILTNSLRLLADKCIDSFKVNHQQVNLALDKNPILVTSLNTKIGYNRAASIAKKAYASQRPILDVALEETELTRAELETLLDPLKLTQGGLAKE